MSSVPDDRSRPARTSRPRLARTLRPLLTAGTTALVVSVVLVGVAAWGPADASELWPAFLAGAAAVVAVRVATPRIERATSRIGPSRPASYTVLAAIGAGSGDVDDALAELASVLAEGTRARSATVWLALEGGLTPAAVHPEPELAAPPAADLAALLDRADVHHAVPVLVENELRAVLVLDKPGQAITPADRRLVRDVATGAALLLREVRHSTELATRVRRADDLARELAESRHRLRQARDAERRRLVSELAHGATDRLTSLSLRLAEADAALAAGADSDDAPRPGERAGHALARSVDELESLLDRFRTIVRGVYPSVLAAQGLRGALEEMAADLPRSVVVTGELPRRPAREIESGLYYVAASAAAHLAGRTGGGAVELTLRAEERRVSVHVVDAARVDVAPVDAAPVDAAPDADSLAVTSLRAAVADDLDRLAALGGDLDVGLDSQGSVHLTARVPDDLEPEVLPAARPAPGTPAGSR